MKRDRMSTIERVAILDLYYGKSGKLGFYNSQAVGLAKAFSEKEYEVFIVKPEKGISEIVEQNLEQNITLLTVPAKILGVHSFYDLEFLLKYKIDLVHLNADNQAYVPGVIRYCKKHHILQYNYVGTLYSDSENKLKQFLMRFFSNRNVRYYKKSKTFVKTEYVLQQLQNKGVKNIKVVPVGLDFEAIPEIEKTKTECRRELDISADEKILLYVGRMAEYKKPLDALNVLKQLPEQYSLTAIGKGELEGEFLKKAESLNLTSRINYIEAIPNIEIHKYYKAADCFVNFNPQEIFGMSVLEAFYQECPVVARHAPGPDAIIVEGETGYLCDTVDEMCEKIKMVTPSMGTKGKKRVERQFSWKFACSTFLNEFNYREKQEMA